MNHLLSLTYINSSENTLNNSTLIFLGLGSMNQVLYPPVLMSTHSFCLLRNVRSNWSLSFMQYKFSLSFLISFIKIKNEIFSIKKTLSWFYSLLSKLSPLFPLVILLKKWSEFCLQIVSSCSLLNPTNHFFPITSVSFTKTFHIAHWRLNYRSTGMTDLYLTH